MPRPFVCQSRWRLSRELFANQAVNQRNELLIFVDETAEGLVPVELEAGRKGRDPDLADGRIGRDDELGGVRFKENLEDAALDFGLEGVFLFFAGVEMIFEGLEGTLGMLAEEVFVAHGASLQAHAACDSGKEADLAIGGRLTAEPFQKLGVAFAFVNQLIVFVVGL